MSLCQEAADTLNILQAANSFIQQRTRNQVFIVEQSGRIIETGNHGELLAQRGDYYKLYNPQIAQ
jgi:ABC-type multidrug transport system fused ATPase/permease subunit